MNCVLYCLMAVGQEFQRMHIVYTNGAIERASRRASE